MTRSRQQRRPLGTADPRAGLQPERVRQRGRGADGRGRRRLGDRQGARESGPARQARGGARDVRQLERLGHQQQLLGLGLAAPLVQRRGDTERQEAAQGEASPLLFFFSTVSRDENPPLGCVSSGWRG